MPLANVFGYPARLAALAAGRVTFDMAYDQHAAVEVFSDDPNKFSPVAAAMRP